MDKNAIKKYAIWARRELISRVSQKALQYGISAEKHGNPDADNVNGRILTPVEQQQRRSLIQKINADGYEQAMEEAAYTWFNRFTALRYMEVNGYLPSHVRVFTNEENAFKPQIIVEAIHLSPKDFEDGLDMEQIYAFKDANDTEGLYKYLLIMQCNAFKEILPCLFTSIMDFTVLLFPDNLLREGSVIEQMISMIPEEDWKDQVQIIGWLYQYYNSEKKDAVFAAMSQKVKVSKENIAPATQLFTPDWIVRYMVENSLGRLWVDGHADTTAKAEWKYYLEEAEQTPEVQAQLAEIRESRKDLTPEQIRFIDPCMGSGHILVYAFDVLMQIYLSYGYSEREAAESIVRNNLWGLDLDKRAYQLAYFAVMMKGRQYDRRFLKKVIKPNLAHFQDMPKVDTGMLDEPLRSFVEQFENADTYGSLISVQDGMDEGLDPNGEIVMDGDTMEHLMQLYKILSQRYDVVCTNPPYMGMSNANAVLKNYVEKKYPDSKADLFAVFIEKCSEYAKNDGYYAMITQHAWMFLTSFEKLRIKLQLNTTINMAHLGARAFDEIGGEVVQTTAFVKCNQNIVDYAGTYKRLIDGSNETEKCNMFFIGEKSYRSNSSCFSKIPGSPVAYWVNESFIRIFENPSLSSIACPCQGMATTNNDLFLKHWVEVNYNSIKFDALCEDDTCGLQKWFPYNKGGDYRKWYGNNLYVVNFHNHGKELCDYIDLHSKVNHKGRVINRDKYFKENGTWSAISSGKLSVRYSPIGFIISNAGMAIYSKDKLKYIIAFMNTKTVSEVLLPIISQTLNFNAGDIERLPIILTQQYEERISITTDACIKISKSDWDSFETSWDFKRHPFIEYMVEAEREEPFVNCNGVSEFTDTRVVTYLSIENAFLNWQRVCEERFNQLKSNEEELNRIFIDIYGLQDELTPEVEDKDVTVRKADLQRDIKSFISYAVGCMFGRYSLDCDGLAYAGGDLDASKYTAFTPTPDNIIPICDDDYFAGDITARFVEFVRTVFGAETLEENLQYIAAALGGKGTARDAIRSYFMNSFYADHCKIYQKRPIYWLFDSGKKNGFKALIYLHRYQPDTIARVRTGYVHELQARYRTAIEDLEKRVNAASGSEAVKLKKALTKLNDQAEELTAYEEIVHHLADQMIKIDLDDGVKHNYAIFKDVLAKLK